MKRGGATTGHQRGNHPANGGVKTMLSTFIRGMSAYIRARRNAHALDGLSDEQLKDIGFRRSEPFGEPLRMFNDR
jgi:uncharacterized protein YjiS (DUF1127 family)